MSADGVDELLTILGESGLTRPAGADIVLRSRSTQRLKVLLNVFSNACVQI